MSTQIFILLHILGTPRKRKYILSPCILTEHELLLCLFLLCGYNNTATRGARFHRASVKLTAVYELWSQMQTPLSLSDWECLPGFIFPFIFPDEFQMCLIWEQDIREALM